MESSPKVLRSATALRTGAKASWARSLPFIAKPSFTVGSRIILLLLLIPVALRSPIADAATAVGLGEAGAYAVLAGSTVTNTGPTVVNGDLGVHPGTAVTGFPPGVVNGQIHAGDNDAARAKDDLVTAFNALGSQPCDATLTGDLGGRVLTTGVYCFTSSAGLTGQLTLDAQGDPNAVFIFKIGSTLITAPGSSVLLVNGANACNVFWQIGSSATLGTTTQFVGNILALTSITLNTNANINGRLLARNGAVTLDDNDVTLCAPPPPPPPPPPPAPPGPPGPPPGGPPAPGPIPPIPPIIAPPIPPIIAPIPPAPVPRPRRRARRPRPRPRPRATPTPIPAPPAGPLGGFELAKTHQFKGGPVVNTDAKWVFTLRNDEGRVFPCTLPKPSNTDKCTTNENGNDHTLRYEGLPADTYVLCERAFENWRPQYSNAPPGAAADRRCLTFTLGPGQELTSANDSELRVNNFCPTPRRSSRIRR